MTSRLNPYLHFDGVAREAIEHYQAIFGGELRLTTYGQFGQPDSPFADRVMHAQLETDAGYTIMASDGPPGSEPDSGSAITVSLSGDDEADLRRYWEGLVDGGTVTVPLETQPWGDTFGMCVDRFGVAWMVNIGSGAA